MKKIRLVTILTVFSIGLVACRNPGVQNNGNQNNANGAQNGTESIAQNSSDSGTQSNNVNTTDNISVDQAKEIALSHAGLRNDQVTFVQANKELDDGIEKYDIEFYCNGKEYDYEINASDGRVIQYSHDMEKNQTPNNDTTNKPNDGNTKADISAQKAKEIALSHAGLKSNQVAFKRTELEIDDGIKKYEVEFNYNNKEYSYEIDADTGKILSYEQQ